MKRFQFMAAIALLAQQILVVGAVAANPAGQSSGKVEGFVVPSSVQANEPFTFASQGSVEGEVVDIKTVEGEVVATKKTDRLGRVFLSAGLAAGSYLLSANKNRTQTQIQVKPGAPANSSNALDFHMPSFVDQSQGLNLSGTGFSGNAADLAVSAGNVNIPVLASTPRELKTGALAKLRPGNFDFRVKNLKSGEMQKGNRATVYSIQSKLAQQKVASGQTTMLQFTVLPKETVAEINVRIESGPVQFASGGKEAKVTVRNGAEMVPLQADPAGSGRFNIAWELVGIMAIPIPGGRISDPPKQESTEPCPATRHTMKPIGVWKEAGKRGDQFLATRERQCYVQECRLKKGHGGDHEFGASKACPDKDRDIEEKTFETDADRAKFIKESKSGG